MTGLRKDGKNRCFIISINVNSYFDPAAPKILSSKGFYLSFLKKIREDLTFANIGVSEGR
jgi:hypothetical protein